MTEVVLKSVSDGVATVTLNRPDAMNALSRDVRKQLAEVMRESPTVFYRLYAEAENRNGPELSDTFIGMLDRIDAALAATGIDPVPEP